MSFIDKIRDAFSDRDEIKEGEKDYNFSYNYEEEQTNYVDEILEKYEKMDIEEKLKFYSQLPVRYSTMFVLKSKMSKEEYNRDLKNWVKNNNFSFGEYQYFQNAFRKKFDKNADEYRMIKDYLNNKIREEYGMNDISTIEVKLCSTSDNQVKDKIDDSFFIFKGKNNILFLKKSLLVDGGEYEFLGSIHEEIQEYVSGDYKYQNRVIMSIPIKDIEFYKVDGQKTINTIISGGGATGKIDPYKANSYKYYNKSTPIGRQIDANVGALYSMLSDLNIEPIRTSLYEEDDRIVLLRTKKAIYIFERFAYSSGEDLYTWLIDKIPDLDFEKLKMKQNLDEHPAENYSNLDEIKKLKELLDIDAITKEEYEKKKKELLK